MVVSDGHHFSIRPGKCTSIWNQVHASPASGNSVVLLFCSDQPWETPGTSASPTLLVSTSSLATPDLSLWGKGCLQTGSCDMRRALLGQHQLIFMGMIHSCKSRH